MKNKFQKIILSLLIASLIAGTAHAFFFGPKPKKKKGGSVFGIVIGPSGSNTQGSRYMPIEGAAVELRGEKGTMTTQTSDKGGFQFESVPAGDWTLQVNKPGYGPHIEKFTLKDAELKRVKNVALVPGGGLSTPGGVIVPDTVYVAFAKIETEQYANRTTRWRQGAIAQGADPLALDGNAPDYGRNMNPYDKGHMTSMHANTLMTINPADANDINYVKLDGRPTWLKFNVAGTKLYVATDQNYVFVYDILHNNILIGSVSTPSSATDLALSPDGKWLFISYGLGGILVVDTKNHAVVNNIETPALSSGEPGMPMGIAVSRDGLKLYVALSSMNSGEVVCIDAYSKQPVARAPVGAQPIGIVMSPDGSKLYVANNNSASVSVLSTSPLSLINNVSVGVSPTKVAITPDGSKVFVSCRGSNTVSIVSGFSGTPMGSVSVGKEPIGVAVTGDGSRVYVSNHGEGTVSIIDTNANFVIKTTRAQPNSRPFGIAVKP